MNPSYQQSRRQYEVPIVGFYGLFVIESRHQSIKLCARNMANNMFCSKPMNHSHICSMIVAVCISYELLHNKQGHNSLSCEPTNVVWSVGLSSDGRLGLTQQGHEPVTITNDQLVLEKVRSLDSTIHLFSECCYGIQSSWKTHQLGYRHARHPNYSKMFSR